jgi:hypothetical protein
VRHFVVEMERLEAKRGLQSQQHSLSSDASPSSITTHSIPTTGSPPSHAIATSSDTPLVGTLAAAIGTRPMTPATATVSSTASTMSGGGVALLPSPPVGVPVTNEATPLVASMSSIPVTASSLAIPSSSSYGHHGHNLRASNHHSRGSDDSRASLSSINIGGIGGEGHPPRSPSISQVQNRRNSSSLTNGNMMSPVGSPVALVNNEPVGMTNFVA